MGYPHIITLHDDELDSVVGGTFNQSVASLYDLKIKTANSGAQFVRIKVCVASGTGKEMRLFSTTGMCSEESLNFICNKPDLQSLAIQNNKGEWVPFSKEQCNALLKE